MTTTKSNQIDLSYSSDSISSIADIVKQENNHLCLFLGLYTPNKKEALQKLASALKLPAEHIDLNDYVVKSEQETIENLNTLFDTHNSEEVILYFEHGDKLCGAYTGFSHSRVKYASPQERHFLRLVENFNGLVVVDISEYTAADKTIRRAAQSIIRFDLPDSKLKRFIWHLKNYTLHGFELKTKRPDSYGEVPGNF
ncbi:MAG: hypothetical protein U5J95_02265 [Balneolaceae bacterium]|nr:hypothetical protein [Balneolaceae bacterium]